MRGYQRTYVVSATANLAVLFVLNAAAWAMATGPLTEILRMGALSLLPVILSTAPAVYAIRRNTERAPIRDQKAVLLTAPAIVCSAVPAYIVLLMALIAGKTAPLQQLPLFTGQGMVYGLVAGAILYAVVRLFDGVEDVEELEPPF